MIRRGSASLDVGWREAERASETAPAGSTRARAWLRVFNEPQAYHHNYGN